MKKINLKNTEIQKAVSKQPYYDFKLFERDVKNYISAIKEGRMMCSIHSVSKSGMSRTLSFHSCEKAEGRYWYRQYINLFEVMGHKRIKDTDHFRIYGCGMDMVFHTNYSIIHQLESWGILTKEECAKLAQMTPIVL